MSRIRRSYEDANAKRISVGEQNVSHRNLQPYSVEYGCQFNQAGKFEQGTVASRSEAASL